MKRLLVLITFLVAALGCRPAADAPKRTFYLQLIRGSDQDAPPGPDAKSIGPKLDERLRSVFKWRRYWELKRDSVVVKPGQKVRKQMSPERDVEIELRDSQRIAARIFLNGTLTRAITQPAEAVFFIAGWNREGNQSWFIVVRRDPPPDSEVD